MSAANRGRGSSGDGSGKAATLVAAGILLSRIVGLVRQKVFAYYFGVSEVGDAFTAALRIPNFLQNLFGEGVLSASFIPVYATLRARGEDEARRELAGTIFSILSLLTAILVLVGIFAAPILVGLIAPGFSAENRELTVRLVRILFPGAGLLVWSAWCLGVLNSHGKFFLSYASPVVWNVAMIATLLFFGRSSSLDKLAEYLAWGAVAGSALQFAVQLPTALRVLGGLRLALRATSAPVRDVLANFVPVFFGRGVSQISAFVDSIIASLIVTGAVVTLGYAQLISMLPISLFGMSVSAAELPAMSGTLGSRDEIAAQLRARLGAGLRRIAFWIIPSAVAFAAFGDLIAAVVYQGGRFGVDEARWVWSILAGSAVGLLAATMGRLYASTFYALRDTRTPLRFALVRMVVSTALGLAFALPLPRALGIDPRWGVAALTMASGIAAWTEFALLRRALASRIGAPPLELSMLVKLWGSALVAAALGWGVRMTGEGWPLALRAVPVLVVFGFAYLVLAWRSGSPEAAALLSRFRRGR